MLLTLLGALNTTDLKQVAGHLSMAPLDIDLLLYKAQEDGDISIDKKKGKIKALKEEPIYYDAALAQKLIAIIKQYDLQEANITRNRLEEITLALNGRWGYPIHDFICTLYALEQGVVPEQPKLYRYEIGVPEIKDKRPYNLFIFYTFLDHKEFGTKAVNDFVAQWDKLNVK